MMTLKLRCYNSKEKQYQQNHNFRNNQKALNEELGKKVRQDKAMPDAEQSIKF